MSSGVGAPPERSRAFWPCLVIGGAVMVFGVVGLLGEGRQAELWAVGRYILGFAILHDALIAPAVFAVALLVGRLLPAAIQGPVGVALTSSAFVVVFSIPLVRRFGARSTNASALPLDYGRNVLVLLAVIWAMTAVVVVIRLVRPTPPSDQGGQPGSPPPPAPPHGRPHVP